MSTTALATTGGDAFRDLRLALGLTQDELSEIAHINQGHISQIENGHRPLTAEIAMRIIRRAPKVDGADPTKLLDFIELGGYLAVAA